MHENAAVEGSRGAQHVLVAGARDALLSVWPLTPSSKSRTASPLPPNPSHFLYGHDAPITALATSAGLRTAVSGATNSNLLLHHVPTGRLLRVFPRLPRPASLVAISDVTPAVVSYCPALRRLHCFHIQVRNALSSCIMYCFFEYCKNETCVHKSGELYTVVLVAVYSSDMWRCVCREMSWQQWSWVRWSHACMYPRAGACLWWQGSALKGAGGPLQACAKLLLPCSCGSITSRYVFLPCAA